MCTLVLLNPIARPPTPIPPTTPLLPPDLNAVLDNYILKPIKQTPLTVKEPQILKRKRTIQTNDFIQHTLTEQTILATTSIQVIRLTATTRALALKLVQAALRVAASFFNEHVETLIRNVLFL